MRNIFTLCILISNLFQEIFNQYIEMHFPLKFENIEILYTSKFEIYYDYKVIVDYSDEILFWDQKDSNIKKLKYKGFEFSYFNYYPNIETVISFNMKPQDYIINDIGINYYFSQYCSLYIYDYYDEPKWERYKRVYFENLENIEEGNCVLEMAFNNNKKNEIAIYNLNNKKIMVVDLYKEIIDGKKNNAIIVNMEKFIAQALIYSDEDGTKLIGIDLWGTIKFWGLHGFIQDYWLINSFNFDFLSYCFLPAGIIGEAEKKLLYINNDNFILFDLKKVKIINQQKNLISGVSTLLILDNGQALVGTKKGFIYLIGLFNNEIKVLDNYELCKGKLISNISYNTSCPGGHEICYIFAANCGYSDGYLKIFKIKNENNDNF